MNPELEEGWYWVRERPVPDAGWEPGLAFVYHDDDGQMEWAIETLNAVYFAVDQIEIGPRIHPPEGEGEER